MKIRRIISVAPLWVAATLALTLVGCVDKDYDLGEVDMTIGTGGNLSLPSNNSTENVCLDDVLDLGNNNFLKVSQDGMYNIDVLDDETFTAHMWVDEFYIPKKTYNGSYTINLGDFRLPPMQRRLSKADDEIVFNAPMVDLDFTYAYNTTQITRLDYLGVRNGLLTTTLTFANDLQKALSNIAVITFALPRCVKCGKAAYKGYSISLSEDNVLELHNVKPSEGLTFTVNIKGIDLTGTKGDGSFMTYTKGEGFRFHGAVNMGVVVKESAIDFDQVSSTKDLTVHGQAVLNRMRGDTATGIFTPTRSFGRVGGVALRNIPSFLSDDETNLDLYDPQLNINIYSNVPFANKMTGAIVAKDIKGNVLKRIQVPEFSYKANGESVISVRRRPSNSTDTTIVVVPDICDVIKILPDSIALIDLVGRGDETQVSDITLDTDYRGTIRLSVASGIALGSDARIVYSDEYTGWNDHVKDISFVEKDVDGAKTIDGYLKVTANVESTIPAYLKLSAYGLDAAGKAIDSSLLAVDVENIIKASPDGKTPQTSEVVIYVRPKDNSVFKKLDGLAFRVLMSPKGGSKDSTVAGVMLNAYNQTVKVTSLKVMKVGKVAIDCN